MITTAPSWQDLFDIGRAALLVRNPNLKIVPGDVTDAVLVGGATMGSQVISFAAGRFLSTFLDGASGVDLTNLARDRGVSRDPGDFAIGTVTVFRSSSLAGAGTMPAGTRIATVADATGKFSIYTTNVDVPFGPTDTGPHNVGYTCTKTGTAGNVDAGNITRVLDQLWDQTVFLNQSDRAAGGAPAESDEDLRDRVRGFFLTQARGTRDALIFGAKTVAGVKRASLTVDYATGLVTVYVSDAAGNANQAMTDAVQAELENNWADAGDPISVIGATLVIESIDYSLAVRVGVDINALLNNVNQAIISRLARLSPGDTLYRDAISAAIRAVDPISILSARINTPAVDLVPAAGQVFRTDLGHVTHS